MDPITIATLGAGAMQTLAGLFVKKGPRPNWQIPGAAYEELATARGMASTNVRPGNQIAVDQIDKSAASQVGNINRSASSGSQALASADKVGINQNAAITQNNAANAQYSFNAKQNLQAILGKFAGYQREQFMKNVWEPYMQRVETKNMLIGSGIQNIFGGLNSAATANIYKNMYQKQDSNS